MLDEDQELAFRLSNCHNLIISGQAGTGKTYLVKRIVRHWTNEKKIAIVCSTGENLMEIRFVWAHHKTYEDVFY